MGGPYAYSRSHSKNNNKIWIKIQSKYFCIIKSLIETKLNFFIQKKCEDEIYLKTKNISLINYYIFFYFIIYYKKTYINLFISVYLNAICLNLNISFITILFLANCYLEERLDLVLCIFSVKLLLLTPFSLLSKRSLNLKNQTYH